ncbi:PREDICTED: probable WRKY transcription factor 70 [Ipomoea nil]|uniref:probable WRKY transcription factor 70 n=1 Tax=Ipomoea nil TaxID=35883 RepID=UPI000900A21C|nr:PREDICTED: probable WRKY transcription factor 70 [Ipomoea nil]
MAHSSPENSSANRKRAVDGLILGRNLTCQLREMLKNSDGGHGPPSKVVAEDLVVKILESFNEGISVLGSMDSDEVSQPPCDGRKSEDISSGSCKTSAPKDGRGCYKRRKTCEILVKDSQTLVDDGHAWRKYGQKVILNTPFPRNYYRCTHKFDQKCQATKQVQRIRENPPLYRTTYNGNHTCLNFQKYPQIILDSTAPGDSSFLLCFGQNGQNNKEVENPTLIKQENKQEFAENLYHNVHHSQIQTSSSGCCLPSDDRPMSSAQWGPAASSGSEYGDVNSSAGCTHDDLTMQMMSNVDVDDDFTLRFLADF